MWVYRKTMTSEGERYEVGYYYDGAFFAEECCVTHIDVEEAARRVHWLNGGDNKPFNEVEPDINPNDI